MKKRPVAASTVFLAASVAFAPPSNSETPDTSPTTRASITAIDKNFVHRDARGEIIELSVVEADDFRITNGVLEEVARLSKLKRLGLSFETRHFGLPALEATLKATPATAFYFACRSHLDDDVLTAFGRSAKVIKVGMLGCEGVTSKGLSAALQAPSLKEVHASGSLIDASIAEAVNSAPALEKLVLNYAPVGDQFLERLDPKIKLISLTLFNCKVTGAGVAGLSRMANLESISANEASLTRAQLEQLAAAPRLRSVRIGGDRTQLEDVVAVSQDHPMINFSLPVVIQTTVRGGQVQQPK